MKPLGYIPPPRARLPDPDDHAAHWIIVVLAVAIVGLAVVWWKQKHGA